MIAFISGLSEPANLSELCVGKCAVTPKFTVSTPKFTVSTMCVIKLLSNTEIAECCYKFEIICIMVVKI